MASKPSAASVALFLICNILFFTFGNACGTCNRSPPPPRRSPPPPPPRRSPPPPPPPASCPLDALKLGVCADVLGLVNATVGDPPKLPCCSLLGGLVDLEAALCLCTAIKANILGIDLNIPISLSLVLNYCGKGTPSGFQCP